MTSSKHRNTGCADQPTCGAGKKMSAVTLKEERTCIDCDANTYRDTPGHRNTVCINQPSCSKGEKYAASSLSEKRKCSSCASETYQDEDSHRDTACKDQTECGQGQKINSLDITKKESCRLGLVRAITPALNWSWGGVGLGQRIWKTGRKLQISQMRAIFDFLG